jgi:transposase
VRWTPLSGSSYNKALDARQKAWYRRSERINYVQTSAMLTKWKRRSDLAFLNEVSSVPLQQVLRHLQKAYAGFFEGRTGYPRFKRKRILTGSAEYTKSGFTWRGGELKLAKHTMPLAERTFTCPDPGCGHIENRDVNAAKNILAAGLAVAACGDGVRPKRR